MIKSGDRVFAGVSGGADSVCLCLILKELSSELGFNFEVIHVEHGIRGEESRADAKFVRELCSGLGIVYHERSADVPAYALSHHLGLEEAARILRYDIFSDIAAGEAQGEKVSVALAHHMEDNAETILMQMVRGSGIDGLCGMDPVRYGAKGEVYIRPLLSESRAAIEAFLRERGQDYCVDSTNADLSYSRNRIRKNILPELTALNGQAILHINQTACRMREIREYIGRQAEESKSLREKEGAQILPVQELISMPRALRLRLIHKAVAMAAGVRKDIAAVHIEAVEALLFKQSGKKLDLPYNITAKRVYDEIRIRNGEKKTAKKPSKLIDISGIKSGGSLTIDLGGAAITCRLFPFCGKTAKIPRKMYTKWFDYDKIRDNFYIRTREAEDYFMLSGGHRKKLSDYFIDEKIPADRRDSCLLAAQGSKVFWIIGGRMGQDVQVTEDTRLILELEYTEDRQ